VASAWAYGCSGSASSVLVSATKDGGAPDGRGRDLTVTDARAGDDQTDDASGDSKGDVADVATNAAPGNSSSQYCCVSDAYYVCPSAAAIAQCTSACTRDPSKDPSCASSDMGSSGGSAPALPAAPKNACGGPYTGFMSGAGGSCFGGQHLAGNACYPNDVGNPCTYPIDCGDGNHCTSGCCAGPAAGSACTAPWDCTSGTCTNGVCQ
jgi:hypothetical protein